MSELSYVDELLSFFKALSEKTRLRILSLLIDKSYAVEEIAEIWKFLHYISQELPDPISPEQELYHAVANIKEDIKEIRSKLGA